MYLFVWQGEHARYVLQMSPVLEDRQMGLISFDKFYYGTHSTPHPLFQGSLSSRAYSGLYLLGLFQSCLRLRTRSLSRCFVPTDTTDHAMKAMDPSRPDDFISISGSKMRALARQGATPCPDPIPPDLLAANCVPKGFMVQKGWDIVCDYYQVPAGGARARGSSARAALKMSLKLVLGSPRGRTEGGGLYLLEVILCVCA